MSINIWHQLDLQLIRNAEDWALANGSWNAGEYRQRRWSFVRSNKCNYFNPPIENIWRRRSALNSRRQYSFPIIRIELPTPLDLKQKKNSRSMNWTAWIRISIIKMSTPKKLLLKHGYFDLIQICRSSDMIQVWWVSTSMPKCDASFCIVMQLTKSIWSMKQQVRCREIEPHKIIPNKNSQNRMIVYF